jgi:hypothetical protein
MLKLRSQVTLHWNGEQCRTVELQTSVFDDPPVIEDEALGVLEEDSQARAL